ncbi:MAG: ArsR family transcriptional regulator [Haloferacaceae archaeon]
MGTNEPTSVRGDGTLSESDAFHILGNDRRRELIATIADRPDGVVVSDLAEEIARREQDGGNGDPTRDLYKSVYVSLQQTHLPKLADEGVIRYDPETNRVEPGPRLDEVTVYVTDDARPSRLRTWPLVVSLVGLAVLLAAMGGVPLVSAVSAPVWAVVFLSAIAVLGAYAWLR